MKTIDDFNYKNAKVLVRADLNVPLDDLGQVADDTRIRRSLPTIEKILNDGGSVILMSHLGRPKGRDEKYSLKHILPVLEKLTGRTVRFAEDITGPQARRMAAELKPGEILLLENLRFDPREKKGDETFARELAELGDYYVNDAFGTAHRAHASTATIAKFFPGKKAAGYLLASEVKNIKKALEEGQPPVTAILGGAKVSSKLGVIENLLDKTDRLAIVGGMAYTFLKALGYPVGRSLVEEDLVEKAKEILDKAPEKGTVIILPSDFVIADRFAPDAETRIVPFDRIPDDWMGLDIGPETRQRIADIVKSSKTVIWNGPAGVFEWEPFAAGTMAIAKALAEATEGGTFTLAGGGDSVAALKKAGVEDRISYVSTGGGAMLEMLEGKELPGIKALEE
ncbi:MAG: phosphoglycerate kinase [Chlorobi bacterium]|nr:phosphoglycerate kinase [Chlorobiota bacterium]